MTSSDKSIDQTFVPHISVFIEKKGKLLLVKEGKTNNYGKWNLPGGHLEIGERFADAACREVMEETNLKVKLKSIIGIYTSWRKKHYIQYVYHGVVESGKLKPQEGEILDCHWFPISEVERMDESLLLFPAKMRKIIEDFHSGKGIQADFVAENY